jgi:penicillin-binding protein 1A
VADLDSDVNAARFLVPLALGSAMVPVATIAILAATLYSVPSSALPSETLDARPRITRLYASDGSQIAALRGFETFIPVTPGDLPQSLKDAVVAIEDERFHSHRGVDVRGVLRALWTNLMEGEAVEGGSTITQQYVKQVYMGDRDRSLGTKVREAVLATRVEKRLSKDEILHRYLSTVYFGGGAYGVGAAAQSYFRKPVSELTLSESALLAALIRAPSRLNPRSSPGAAEWRRRMVLHRMLDQGRVSTVEARTALDEPVLLATDAPPDRPATLVYPRAEDPGRHRFFVDYVRRYLIARYGATRVFNDGLRVETTLDTTLQALAEATIEDALEGTSPPLEMSLVSLDPSTGFVKALVAGRDFDRSQVNLALGNCENVAPATDQEPLCIDGGGTGRQPGSAFKPFILAAALEEGMSLDKRYPAPARYTFPRCRTADGCTVKNAGGRGYGRLALREATARSVNTVFAQLIGDVGVKDTAALAHRLGVTMIDPEGQAPNGERYGASLALGAREVSPLDMAAAYGVFANRGVRLPATPVLKVTTADGRVLEDNTNRRGRRVLSPSVADNVSAALRDVVESGTGRSAAIDRSDAAGKTGTTDNHSDAWFVGFTPDLSTSVWMGYADSQRPLRDVAGQSRVYGGTIPATTWARFMEAALEGDAGSAMASLAQ